MTRPLCEVLRSEPVFAVTADMDWASEACIETLIATCAAFSIKPMLFVTHDSPAISAAARAGRVDVGIHPNFLPDSSHGSVPAAVIKHVLQLAPRARASRGHCFASSSHIIKALHEAGIDYDGGPLAFRQQGLTPIRHHSGLLHLPVFWEDDVHWGAMPDWNFEMWETEFLKPGLKVVNIHPFFFKLNIPNASFYQQHKAQIQTLTDEDAERLKFQGDGCTGFTRKMLSFISRHFEQLHSLNEIADWARDSPIWASPSR